MIARLLVVVFLLAGLPAAFAQQIGGAQFPIKGEHGTAVANHALSAEQMAQVERLPGLVNATVADGDVTIYQFYDLNCPYCRRAAADIGKLIAADPAVRLVFVPYPVLSVQSIEASRVELAVRELAPERFFEFHRKVYAGRGVIDGARAAGVTDAIGLDRNKIIEIANKPGITDIMRTHARVGGELKLVATPAYVIHGVAIVGHPGLESLRKVVASVRSCKKVVC
ncbi:MAG: DsbA family protein [Xanthobacteraceae bacterium]|nr:DsbA family protein [Xanthobacteraceae bacterium]